MTLIGTSSLANYQTALQSVTYSDSSSNPNTMTRTVSFTVNDVSLVASAAATRGVTVTAVKSNATHGHRARGSDGRHQCRFDVLLDQRQCDTVADVDGNSGNEQLTITVTAGSINLSTMNGLTGSGNGGSSLTYIRHARGTQHCLERHDVCRPGNDPGGDAQSLAQRPRQHRHRWKLDGTGAVTINVSSHQDVPPTGHPHWNSVELHRRRRSGRGRLGHRRQRLRQFQSNGRFVSITTGFDATQTALAFTNQNGITGTYSAGVLTFSGLASVAD